MASSWRVATRFNSLGLYVDFDESFGVHLTVAKGKLVLCGLRVVRILPQIKVSLSQQFAPILCEDSKYRLLLAELAPQ